MLFRPKIKRIVDLVFGRNSQPRTSESVRGKNASRRKLFSIGWPGWIISLYRFLLKSARFYAARFLYLGRVILRGKRFIFGIIALIFIFTGTTPFDLYRKTIEALTGKTEIINLYANNCTVPDQSDDFKSGWWKGDKAVGAPDLGPDADQLAFSDENSAFYSGGDYSLVCGDFMFLTEAPEDNAATGSENYINTEPSLPKTATETPAASADEENGASINEATGSSDKLLQEQEKGTSGADIGEAASGQAVKAEIMEQPVGESLAPDEGGPQVEIKQNSEAGGDVEIIDKPAGPAEAPEIISPKEDAPAAGSESAPEDPAGAEGTDEGPVSFLQKVKQFFNQPSAIAQEFLAGKTKTLEDLGKFKSAKIKFSLALINKPKPEQKKADIPSPVEAENSLPSNENKDLEQEKTATGTGATGTEAGAPVDKSEADVSDEAPGDGSGTSADEAIDSGTVINPDIEEADAGHDSGVNTNGQNVEIKEDSKTVDNGQAVEIIDSGDSAAQVEIKDEAKPLPEPESKDAQDVSLLDKFINSVNAQTGEARLVIWYSLGNDIASSGPETSATNTPNRLWQKLDTITGDNLSNALNNGYLSYGLDFINSWPDIKNLKIKIEGLVNTDSAFIAYLDSVWIEAEYEPESELDKLKKRQRWEEALDFLSQQTVFQAGENGEMAFRYNKNEERLWDTLGEILGLANFWKNVTIEARLVDIQGKTADEPLTLIFEEDGRFTVKLPHDMRALKPGEYLLKFHIEDNSGAEPEIFDLEQKFSWGIMAMNFNRSIYAPGEPAHIQMAVLDNLGHTVCDADLELSIKNNEAGSVATMSSHDGTIVRNSECGPETVTDKPDYYADYDFKTAGEYEFTLTMNTAEGKKSITEKIKVAGEEMPFMIERAGPTRIYPKANYGMKVLIAAREDFKGDITETVPINFKITNYELRITNSNERDPFGNNYKYYMEDNEAGGQNLVWQDVEILAGDVLEINYVFDAPDESPELYLLGPLKIKSQIPNPKSQINSKYKEDRQWQIASDAVKKRARTVIFMAGTYNGGASSGQSTNADLTFSSFKFKLAETGVTIKNAFVMFETHYEAYTAVSDTNYTGYKLGFDACETGSCGSLNPFTGTGKVLEDNSNILSYDDAGGGDGESDDVRLLLDVTNESQLAAYTGGGVEYEGQVGYDLKNVDSKTSIASAKAILVLTYTYDFDSPNITNTVIYPLDSTDGSDRGSRVNSIKVCTRNGGATPCPIFDYKMEIPEFPGYATSSYRLAQWFTMYDMNDGNGSTDLDPNLNIQNYDVDSAPFHFESALGGTQCTIPAMYFPDWTNSGYAENSAQQVEYYINSGTNWSVGGEVFETYIASSSAAVKTRTASFPYGVINNGAITSLTSSDVNVYFPENGSATGTVKIKSAWVRIIPNNFDSKTMNTTVSTKVGENATSTDLVYGYNAGTTAVKNSYNIINIIPPDDYAALEEANASNPVTVRVNTTYNNADFGGVSAELMITYTYADEANGYLTSIGLYGGQLTADPATTTTLSTANSVLPEPTGKTILAGALLASYLSSDMSGDVGVGTVYLMDANLSAGDPACTNSFEVEPDDVNSYKELYKNITSALNTTDNQAYTACYSHDESLSATDAAKMNGILYYTYGWNNSPPTGAFITASTTQKSDGSGTVDVGIEVDDPDGQDIRAKLEFATGTVCVFSPSGKPTLDETDSSITAVFDDPYIENDNAYQIGTADGYMVTASGTNSVYFDWLAKSDLKNVEGDYCLRLTANDLNLDQLAPATTTVYVDTLAPTAPGTLSLYSRTGATTTLAFSATSTETNFREYIIYYKQYDGTDPDEGDSVFASSSDENLGNQLFNTAATTSIGGLAASTTYSFVIWAYDAYGNAASSSRADITTNDAPTGEFNSAGQKSDGSGAVEVSIEVADANQHDCAAKLEYALGGSCDFSYASSTTLDASSISADWGSVEIDNGNEYQIGTPSHPIITPASNTVAFNWLGQTDEPAADGVYCLRLTVNDGFDDQLLSATASLTLDNANPSTPGALSAGAVTTDSIRLIFSSTFSSDTNEPPADAYRIFYRKGSGGLVDQAGGGIVEHDDANLDAYDYKGATSTLLSGLDADSWYYFNIWAYDQFGNKATATEISVKTNSTLSNDSLTFTNAQSEGAYSNIAVAGTSTEWNFRAVVTETNGWYAIASTTLRLADNSDYSTPFNDLAFSWNQTADTFSEIGNDALGAAQLSANSTSTCAVNTCTLDFKIIFNKTFSVSSTTYAVELLSGNDSGASDFDSYDNLYQVRFPYVEQIHYRWRNDDGGE